MSEITGYNGRIFTTPFKLKSIELQVKNGFGIIDNKASLSELTVIYGDGKDIFPDDIVFVESDAYNHGWAKNEIQLGDKIGIMVKTEFVRAIKRTLQPSTDANPLWQDKVGHE